MFNVIARRTLNEYAELYPDAKTSLRKLYHELVEADFKNFNELKERYANASLTADERVVFNICGNKYRLVVRFNFQFKAIQIKWFGTHADYDRINVITIMHKRRKS